MDIDPPKALSAEALSIFSEGIGLILSQWWALQMAIENEWGGRDSRLKADQIASDIVSWFTHSKGPLYLDDLEAILDEGLVSLNTEAEDGSVEEVAYKLMVMHEECLEGKFQIESLREANKQKVSVHRVKQVVDDDDDDDDDDDNVDSDNNDVNRNIANENDGPSNMMVDAPESQSNLNPVNLPADESRPKVADETEDGWVQVACRRSRGKRN